MFDTAARLFDPTSLLLVALGTALLATARSTGADIVRALRALRPLLLARPGAHVLHARRDLRRIEAVARRKGLAAADRIKLHCPYVRQALLRLLDGGGFEEWAADRLAERRTRHEAAQGFWRAAADAAPAMGMIGTVVGLIFMFAAMEDPDRIGGAMALAMLTTLYGLILGPVVAGSIAGRLERLSEIEREWQQAVIARLQRLDRAEPPSMIDLVNTLRAAE